MTGLAGHLDIRKEVHLDGLITITATGFATATLYIERESSWFVASDLGLREIDKQRTDIGEDTCVSGRIGAWCAPDGALIDINHLIYIFQTFDVLVGHRSFERTVKVLGKNGLQGFVDERSAPPRSH